MIDILTLNADCDSNVKWPKKEVKKNMLRKPRQSCEAIQRCVYVLSALSPRGNRGPNTLILRGGICAVVGFLYSGMMIIMMI